MWHIIGLFVTVASIAGVAVIFEGTTDAARRLRAYVRTRRAKPSRERETDEPEAIDNWKGYNEDNSN